MIKSSKIIGSVIATIGLGGLVVMVITGWIFYIILTLSREIRTGIIRKTAGRILIWIGKIVIIRKIVNRIIEVTDRTSKIVIIKGIVKRISGLIRRISGLIGIISNIVIVRKIMNFIKLYKVSVIRGFSTPVISGDIDRINNRLDMKVIRLLSLISTILLSANQYKELHVDYSLTELIILTTLSIIYWIHSCWLAYHSFKHVKKIIKSGDLDIRNSPVNKLASLTSKVYYCVKGVCYQAGVVGGLAGAAAGIDSLLLSTGHGPIIYPTIGKVISPMLPVTEDLFINVRRRREDLNLEVSKLSGELEVLKVEGDKEGAMAIQRKMRENTERIKEMDMRLEGIREALRKKNGER